MADFESMDACGVLVPKGGILNANGACVWFICVFVSMCVTLCVCDVGWVSRHAGAAYVLSVLASGASEAQKVEALQAAGIRTAKGLGLCSECSL